MLKEKVRAGVRNEVLRQSWAYKKISREAIILLD